MSENIWNALIKGCLAFAHTRAGDLMGDALSDSGKLVASLFDGASGTTKDRLEQVKKDIDELKPEGKALTKALEPHISKGKTAVDAMGRELGTSPFTLEAAGRAATELGYVLVALDDAITAVAVEAAKRRPDGAMPTDDERKATEEAIRGITAPWKKPFIGMAVDVHRTFDTLAKKVLDVDDAGSRFADQLTWNRGDKKLSLKLVGVSEKAHGPLKLDGATLEAFFTYKDKAKLGVVLKTNVKAGLRSDKMLEKIIPGQGATADTKNAAITLDTKDGLTFGEGPNKSLVLPVRFSQPGVELRQFSIARPADRQADDAGRIDITATVAGKLGTAFAAVIEDGGISILWRDGGDFEVRPKVPTGAGLRVDATAVRGGGYLRYQEDRREYGGVIDLQLAKIGITAIGLIATDPFSMVIVIGVRFLPKIELSFGFTLNGVGGLLAIDRRLDSGALRKGMQSGMIGNLLFPQDPVAQAPTILDQLGAMFPPQPGALVVGPMLELGWGSQAGFVKARVGLVIALPDPKIVVLGAVEIGVPSADIKPELRIVDLRAEILAEITPDYLLILISLQKSTVAKLPINGDIGFFVRWGGGSAFALSVGGFFPRYTPPPELAGIRRFSIDLAPPVAWLKVGAEGYFAITSNTIQFGGKVTLAAALGPVKASAWLQLDALFQWSPRFYFIIILDAGIKVEAFGVTVAGVSFHGELQGTAPWRLEGRATVEILFWDVDVEIGPLQWGEVDTTSAPPISPAAEVRQALQADDAWKPVLPAGGDRMVRLREDATPQLVHPLGSLEVRQQRVPLETPIDRIGSSPVTSRRVFLRDPEVVGSSALQAVSHAEELFSPGHFIRMSDAEQASRPDFETFPCGIRLAPASEVAHAEESGSVDVAWETCYPHESFAPTRGEKPFLRELEAAIQCHAGLMNRAAITSAARQAGNPYLRGPAVRANDTVQLAPAGRFAIARVHDLSPVAGAPRGTSSVFAADWLRRNPDLAAGAQIVSQALMEGVW
jgi:hypothetical protein